MTGRLTRGCACTHPDQPKRVTPVLPESARGSRIPKKGNNYELTYF